VNILFAIIALISNTTIIYFLLFIILSIITFPLKNIKNKIMVYSLSFVLIHAVTTADIILFKIFKYHINGLVLNVIFTPGGIEALDMPLSNYIYFFAIVLIFIGVEISIALRVIKRNKLGKTRLSYIIAVLMCFIIADKLLYAYFDMKRYTPVIKVKSLYPLYLPFTCKKFFRKVLHVKIEKNYNIHIAKDKSQLQYPVKPIKLKEKKNYPNIVWILLDAWRRDAFNKNLTPNIYEFSKNALVFSNHKSSGIATRFGVFSLFYGIYGTYWHKFLENKRAPVFLDTLKKLNYDFKILTSSPLTFPEFDQTVFVKLHDKINVKPVGNTAAEKDRWITQKFISWLKSRGNSTQPFFSFIFMDAPHAKSFLPDFNKFKTDKNSNYLIVGKKNVTKIKNAYLNAVLTDDFLVNKILSFLKNNNFMRNTVVLISADHGEEFYEHGHLGHTSAFTPEQNNVPLILFIPGMKHKIFKKLTCHYDLVPTMADMLGVVSPKKFYTNGFNLLKKYEHKYVIASSWTNFAVIYNDYRFIFSMASYKAGLFEIRDNNFTLIKDKKLFRSRIKDFARITRELSMF
jgi:membrane-anchored protein YejM (alkaline phosphatase superfamily)